jgi:transcriptional regulator with XRE-family HTH domain
METNFAKRLAVARKMAGLSLQQLAGKLGNDISRQALNKYEQGKMKPGSEMLIRLAEALNVPVDFFYSYPENDITLEAVDFRRHASKIGKTAETAIREKVKDALSKTLELEQALNITESPEYFSFPSVIQSVSDAESAAIELRRQWNLGNDPIPDVVEMLEDKGYNVMEIEAAEAFDGMKAEASGRKIIVLNQNDNPDKVRKRMTALHELAHHSLIFPQDLAGKEEERLCTAFASAVLYPGEMARKELRSPRFGFLLNELVILKERWGISISALYYRALNLGIIRQETLNFLIRNYRANYLHRNEPGKFLSKEKPTRSERLIFYALGQDLISINEAAYFAGKGVWEFRASITQLQ